MRKNKGRRTDFLFATPTFLMGVGSVLNIVGNYFSFNTSQSEFEADFRAIASDWGMIGQDIQEASKEFKQGQIVNPENHEVGN